MTDSLDLDFTDLDLDFEAPKARKPKARKPKAPKFPKFTEMTPRWSGYHLASAPPVPKIPPRGGMIDEVIKENASLRARERRANKQRRFAEYRANFIMNLILAQEN